jgi:BirA family biotin operon repressor/biotin-[acetyl-CoA-carboxylase] ligase
MQGRVPRIIPPEQLHRARDLRRNGTRHEALLWTRLRNSGCGYKFSRQISIGPWIADFVCRKQRLIIELDGGCHDVERDAVRDADLLKRGYRVLRIPNWAIDQDLEGVVRQIVAAIEGLR